jgi:hypothetical protein
VTPSAPLDEPGSGNAFKLSDLKTDGGLGVTEFPGRSGERPRFLDGSKGNEMSYFGTEPSIWKTHGIYDIFSFAL